MSHPHLSDDRLIEVCLARTGGVDHDLHLAACAECQTRHRALAEMLTEIDAAALAEADAAFPADRLARQQARILQRIDQDGRPGRVITFPAGGHPEEPSMRRLRPPTRWIAAAAAAAFIVGLLAGHFAHELPVTSGPPAPRVAAAPAPVGGAYRTVAAVSDDEFLGQIELAVGRSSPPPLRALDALTPRAWDVR